MAVPIFYDKKNTVEYRTHLSMFNTFMRFAWRLTSKMPTAFCFNCLKGLKMRVSDVEMTDPSHPSLYLVKCGNAATQKITSVAPSSRSKRKGCNADSQAFLDSSAIFRVKLWPMGDICEADSCGLNSVWNQKDARWKGLDWHIYVDDGWIVQLQYGVNVHRMHIAANTTPPEVRFNVKPSSLSWIRTNQGDGKTVSRILVYCCLVLTSPTERIVHAGSGS